MSKQIRVSDAAYAVLTREAKANHRSILADQVDAMVLTDTTAAKSDVSTASEQRANPDLWVAQANTKEYRDTVTEPYVKVFESDKEVMYEIDGKVSSYSKPQAKVGEPRKPIPKGKAK